MKHLIDRYFGARRDAYHHLTKKDTTVLDNDDVALVLNGRDKFQFFIREDLNLSDRGMALMEIYFRMVTDEEFANEMISAAKERM